MMSNTLSKLYNDYTDPGGLASARKLYEKARKLDKTIKYEDVKNFLRSNLTYTLHYPTKKNFKRNRIIVSRPHQQAQADLVDMRSLNGLNDGFNYILTFIDCFSKFAYAKPLKNKTQTEVAEMLDSIFSDYPVGSLQVDRGSEFVGDPITQVSIKHKVTIFYTSNSDVKAAIVERFNRTLKSRMYRYFTAYGTRNWINILQDLVNSYNHAVHRTIGMAPSSVTIYDSDKIFKRMFKGFRSELELRKAIHQMDLSKARFKLGDVVRLKYDLSPFDRRYLPNYTDCYFVIDKIVKGYPRLKYKVKLYENNNPVIGSFYEEELQKVSVNEYRVVPIAKKRVNKRIKVLLHFLGYPSEFDQWYDEQDPMVRRLGTGQR